MLKGHLPRVIHHQVYSYIRILLLTGRPHTQHHQWYADNKLQKPKKPDGFPDEWLDLDGLEVSAHGICWVSVNFFHEALFHEALTIHEAWYVI